MIRRRLIAVNVIIITLALGFSTFFEVSVLRNLLVRENTVAYNNMITGAYESLENLFARGEDELLTICANRSIQQLVADRLPEYSELQGAIGPLAAALHVDNITISPVRGNDVYVYDSAREIYDVRDNGIYDYKLDYGYQWEFHPGDADVVRVTRAMYYLDDIEQIIAIVSIDFSMTEFTEIIYSFQGSQSANGYLCLLDESDGYLLPVYYHGQMDLTDAYTGTIEVAGLTGREDTLKIYNTFRQNGWKLVAVLNESLLYLDSRQSIINTVAVTLALEIIGIIATYLITNRITDPLKQLSDEMHISRSRQGYSHIDPPANVSQDIRELYDSYNRLIDEVNLSLANVEEFSRKDAENEFRLLQAEINPHFLYNTLNTISWMAAAGQTDDIQKMIMSLVGLYRISLNNGKSTLTVNDEIEHVRNYLEIMNYRYPGRYRVEYDIDDNTRELIITKQILQPLAENALMHGFLEEGGNGIIRISSHLEGDYLVLKMANTGTKIELDKVTRLLNNDEELSRKHYGIRNVNDRLMMYYGPQCHLEYSIEGEETVVSIRLPVDKLKTEKAYE